MIELIGREESILNKTSTDNLLNFSFPKDNYKQSNTIFEDLIQYGRLKLLRSDDIRQSILLIESASKNLEERRDKITK